MAFAALASRGVIEQRFLSGRAYRDGRLVCEHVGIVIVSDGRIAPDPPLMRRRLSVQFVAGVEPSLRAELQRLLDARGSRGSRLAEALPPIEIVVDEVHGERRMTGRLEAPIARNGAFHEIDFRVRPE
jgi:hypothetical protein